MSRAARSRPLLLDPLFLGVLLLAAAVRVGAALVLGTDVSGLSGANDEITYSTLGERLATGYGLTFPSAWYPWIGADEPQSYFSATMSIFLGAIYAVAGYQPLVARLVMAALSTAVVAAIGLLADRVFGRPVARVSALIAALYGYLVFYGVTLVTETPFVLSVLVALSITYRLADKPTRRQWIALGVTLGLATLLRMAVIFFVVPLLVWLAFRQRRRWRMAVIPAGIIGLSILPFTVHNYLVWGRFLLLESQFGHVFWNGNHPDHQGNFHPFKVFPIPADALASHNDVDITNRLLYLGIHNVLQDPGMFVMLTLTRLREFFLFWPTPDSEPMANALRVLSFGVLVPFALAGLVLARTQWRLLGPIWLFMVMHTLVYALTWTMIRYRVPVDAVLIPFAALGVIRFAAWIRERVGVGSAVGSAVPPPRMEWSSPAVDKSAPMAGQGW